MKYTLEKITTLQACGALLAGAQKKRQDLERKRRNQGEATVRYRQRIEQLPIESAQVQISLAAFITAYEALPAGRDKATLKLKVKRLEAREAMLEKKVYTYNAASLLVRELRYNRLDSQVAALEGYIAAVLQHRVTLVRAARRAARGVGESYPTRRQVIRWPNCRKGVFSLPKKKIPCWRSPPGIFNSGELLTRSIAMNVSWNGSKPVIQTKTAGSQDR